jgi:outer membrane receptor protein involved in Fe transport
MATENLNVRRAVLMVLAAAANSGAPAVMAADTNASGGIEEIVVTGSRIRQDKYSSSAPVDVVSPEEQVARGVTDIASALQTTTVAAGSPQVTAATSSILVQDGGVGSETLSLRGLGANRTLVLLNGRRAGPAGTRGSVSSFDLNVLPLGAVERIDILKDGASSIYGSDAIAGVVNIITKKGDGGSVEAFASRPTKQGGAESRVSATWGRGFDRGNLRITADWYKEAELRRGQRNYFRCGEAYIFDPATGARADSIDPRTGKPHCTDLLWGHVWLYDYATATDDNGVPLFGDGSTNVPSGNSIYLAQYDYAGNLGKYIPGYASDPNNPAWLSTPPGWFPVEYDKASDAVANADHPFQDKSSLNPKVERETFYSDGDIKLSDHVTAYGEVLLNRRKTTVHSYTQFWTYLYNSNFDFSGNPPGAPGSVNPLAAGWTGAQFLSPLSITDHNGAFIDVKYQRFVAGLRGDIGKSWNWDVSFQHSRSSGDYTNDQIYNDAVTPSKTPGSCVGTLTEVRQVPCIDVPWLDPQFLAGNFSPAVEQFLFGKETGNTKYTQWTLEGYASGTLWHLPAGDLSVSVGGQYQSDSITDTPGSITLADNAWGASVAGVTRGSDKTKAVFGEFVLPLLHDLPAVKNLTINGSVRYTNVSSYGGDKTYKAGLGWQILPSFRVRLNRSTSFRSPALFELFLADQTSFLNQSSIDPCILWGDAVAAGTITQRIADNCQTAGIPSDYQGGAASATIVTGGGYGRLKAETSRSNTAGFVWRPAFADFSMSVDYFDIVVNNEISLLGGRSIVRGCYNSLFFPNDPLCSLFSRSGQQDPLSIGTVNDSYVNIAQQKNRGWDIALTYKLKLGPGKLTIDTQHTLQTYDTQALSLDAVTNTNGEFGDPKHVGNLNLTYEVGPWQLYYGVDYIGPVSNESHYGGHTATFWGQTVNVVLKSSAVTYHAASVAREFASSNLKATLGVANIFDKHPPQVTTLNLGELNTEGNSAFYSQYDWIGRRFFLNLKKAF